MKIELTMLLLTAAMVTLSKTQQCREVTRQVIVCDDDANIRGGKGEKGDIGANGKAGPPGSKGSKGDRGGVGDKGKQGESCALGAFETEMREKLQEIENRLIPTSCLTSTVNGKQTLRSGEEAFCDAGWTVFQRRFDGSVNFDLTWEKYTVGFGNMSGEFWLGLDKIHSLTAGRGCRLRIDLWDFDNDHAYAVYSSFSVEDKTDGYKLHVADYQGTAGNSLANNNHNNSGMRFTTKDRDQDTWSSNCASDHAGPLGGWWYVSCGYSRLNAKWGRSEGTWRNIVWYHWKGSSGIALKATTMKLRCD
ncbi:microfibril-associated glycoprotein 4-like [Clavelina lepadiformis]|uniref:microfibril-associated glycoprotein 4-like n=1 Tax=Clavelina lepadiformis TaxID=159417 RepID=UPI004041AFC4